MLRLIFGERKCIYLVVNVMGICNWYRVRMKGKCL